MNSKQLLFIGAHPDDELYAIGTMKLFQEKGFDLFEILFSCGENGSVIRDGQPIKLSKEETKRIRRVEHERAMEALGVRTWECLDSEDGCISRTEELVWKIVSEIRNIRPTIIITHSHRDSHPDHIAVSAMTMEAVRKAAISARTEEFGEQFRVPVVLKVEGYIPEPGAIYVDMSNYKQFKLDYMAYYQSQLSESLVRSTESSDVKNGVIFGVQAAEAFALDPSWPPLVSVL